ncbi:MAG: hypothetical protein GX981_11600 [Tissierellia bacterium]|nr:hypothetical protein [Tissierellia bacterium]
MFPRSIFYLILILIIDLILKSIKDKKKIQGEKENKKTEIPKKVKAYKEPEKTPKREKTQVFKSDKSLEMKSWEEPFSKVYSENQDEIGAKKTTIKREKVFEAKKEDIIKGIIYSEILSKPKSLRR